MTLQTAPYSRSYEFQATSGDDTVAELPAPIRGSINSFSVKQIDGSTNGVTLELYNRKEAASGEGEISASAEDYQDLVDPELHRITDQLGIANGQSLDQHFGVDWQYANRDEHVTPGLQTSRIYLKVTPGGSGVKRFQVAYTIAVP